MSNTVWDYEYWVFSWISHQKQLNRGLNTMIQNLSNRLEKVENNFPGEEDNNECAMPTSWDSPEEIEQQFIEILLPFFEKFKKEMLHREQLEEFNEAIRKDNVEQHWKDNPLSDIDGLYN